MIGNLMQLRDDAYYESLLTQLDVRFSGTVAQAPSFKPTRGPKTERGKQTALAALSRCHKYRQNKAKLIKCSNPDGHEYKIWLKSKTPNGSRMEGCIYCQHRRTAVADCKGAKYGA